MATVTINIPVDKEDWVIDGLAFRFGYSVLINNPDFRPEEPVDPDTNPQTIPNTQTKVEFAKAMIIAMIKDAANNGWNQESFEANKVIANTVELT